MIPKITKKIRREETHHGHTRIDDYSWLYDQSDSEFSNWLEDQDDYYTRHKAQWFNLASSISKEFQKSMPKVQQSKPVRNGSYWYFGGLGGNYDSSCTYRAPTTLNTLADFDDLSQLNGVQKVIEIGSHKSQNGYCAIGSQAISENERYVGYSVDEMGAESYLLNIRDIESAEIIWSLDCIAGKSGLVWRNDDSELWFVKADRKMRPSSVHSIDLETGVVVNHYVEQDERFWLKIGESHDHSCIEIVTQSKETSEVLIVDRIGASNVPQSLLGRTPGIKYYPSFGKNYYAVMHNKFSQDFSLGVASRESRDFSDVVEITPQRDGQRIYRAQFFDKYLAVCMRTNARNTVVLYDRNESGMPEVSSLREATVPVKACDLKLASAEGYFGEDIYLVGQSMIDPPRLWKHTVTTGDNELIQATEIDISINLEDYVQEHHWVTGWDGVDIPCTILYAQSKVPGHGNDVRPGVIFGYGAYERSLDNIFDPTLITLLSRGVTIAVAHVRGGGELGSLWHSAGKRLNKMNSFKDFIACSEYLIEKGFVSQNSLASSGSSAGGLLVAAAANMRPDLYAAVHAGVPFVDPLTAMLDPDLPLTITEYSEWGNPLESAEDYFNILSYAPFDNVVSEDMPAILAVASLHDFRVPHGQAAKWISKIQAIAQASLGKKPAILKTQRNSGHGGASNIADSLADRAEVYAFMLHQINNNVVHRRRQPA